MVDSADYLSLPKVELHNHLDGACKLDTLIDMCRKDNLDIKRFPYNDREAFRRVVSLVEPQASLVDFLKPFPEVCYIISTAENLQRQAFEFCEDQKHHNIIYSEVRLCPFLYAVRGLSPEEALQAVLTGLEKGQKEFDIMVRVIIVFIKPCPDWSPHLVDLAIKYKDKGVVGVDVAGDELQPMDGHLPSFKKAAENGVHITVHAAESGPAENARQAIEDIKTERIGHGYHVIDDPKVYQLAKDSGVHFEVCLTSSIYTCSSTVEAHTVKQFVKDKINFGLNTDDSGIIGTDLSTECHVAIKDFKLTKDQVIESMFNAARASFLPDEEKAALIARLSVLMAQYKTNLELK